MNQEIKEKWIAALRSGKYQQGKVYLRRGDNYCCLGVLCDLKEDTIWNKHFTDGDAPIYNVDRMCDLLPASVSLWSGLDDKVYSFLIDLNDNKEYTFEQIADYIEKNL